MGMSEITLSLNQDDLDALRDGILRDFDEGTLQKWPREHVMRALGFDESHYVWDYFLRDTKK
jgi:hypothetical protein